MAKITVKLMDKDHPILSQGLTIFTVNGPMGYTKSGSDEQKEKGSKSVKGARTARRK